MRRTVLSLAAGFGLLAALSPAPWLARAAGPTPANFQSITGVTGYQFAVPSDWQQLPLFLQERVGDQTFADDGEVASADGTQHAHVETAGGFGVTTSNVSDALTAFLTGLPNVFAGPGAMAGPPSASGAGGGNSASGAAPTGASSPSASGGAPAGASGPSAPTLTVFAQPSSVTVPGADAAVAGAASYTDPNGNPRMIAARMAVKGSTAYLLVIDSTKDFYQNNSALGTIESSFTLSPGASSASAGAPAASSAMPLLTASATPQPAAAATATPSLTPQATVTATP